jgi:signal transduction histidine kinase
MTGRLESREDRDRPRRPRSLRRRIAAGILGVTSLAVLLFAIPLAVAVGRLERGQELAELQRDATRIAALVPDNAIPPATSVRVPDSGTGSGEARVGIYTPNGQLVGGQGPARSQLARSGGGGRVHEGTEAGQLAVAVPVPSDRRVVAVVRAGVPLAEVSSRTRRRWAAMAVLGLGVLAVAGLLARQQARRIAAPLERLTAAARALGDGNFAVPAEHSGIREADAAGVALRDTAARLGRLLQRERAFSADASHQLRTPLTGLLLGLESALDRPDANVRRALGDALHRARRLEQTVDDLLALRRDTDHTRETLDVAAQLLPAGERWQPLFTERHRPLTINVPPALPAVTASAAALRQILDVLLDNALQHGAGTVAVLATDLGDAVAVEVSDEGDGLAGDPEAAFGRRSAHARGHGIGLALARSLAEADGGRLVVRRAAPSPVFALLLPIAGTVVATAPSGRGVAGQPSSS